MEINRTPAQIRNFVLVGCVVVLALMVAIVAITMDKNDRRVVEQSSTFVADSAHRTSETIAELVRNSVEDITALARMQSMALENGDTLAESVRDVMDSTTFESIEFTQADGTSRNMQGQPIDISDAAFFEDGMAGKSGFAAVDDYHFPGDRTMVFYAPITDADGVVGILIGHYADDYVAGLLKADFFGERSNVFICESDGNILCSSPQSFEGSNVLSLPGSHDYEETTGENALKNVQDRSAITLSWNEGSQPGNTCIAAFDPIEGTDWTLVQSFPASATRSMIDEANADSLNALGEALLVLIVVVAALSTAFYIHYRRTMAETRDQRYTYAALGKLYNRAVLIDLDAQTYRFLGGTDPEGNRLPNEGGYEAFHDHYNKLVVGEEARRTSYEESALPHFERVLGPGTDVYRMSYQLKRAIGNRWEDVDVICVERTEDGQPAKLVMLSQDVNAQKERELNLNRALEDSYTAAVEANEAKSEFLSRMSHDIRTPMNAIMGMNALARLHVDDPVRVKDCLDKISTSGQHLLALINEVLDLSRIESGRTEVAYERVDLRRMGADLLGMFSSQAEERNQTLTLDLDNVEHTNVWADAAHLGQVLVNLMGNAIKFTPDGGSVSLVVSESPGRRRDDGRGAGRRNVYQFVVNDSGIGMDSQFMLQMFDPFVRAHDTRTQSTEGTGLGLSISRNLVALMGGSIEAESALGAGSSFTVVLPLLDASVPRSLVPGRRLAHHADATRSPSDHDGSNEEAETEPMHADDGEAQGLDAAQRAEADIERLKREDFSGTRVLVAEDNLLNREIITDLLESMGVEVAQTADGQQAVDALFDNEPNYFDLVFMDIQMPVLGGYDAIDAIRHSERADLAAIPIVALSADAFTDDVRRSLRMGANDHISKPISLGKLFTVMHEQLDGKGAAAHDA